MEPRKIVLILGNGFDIDLGFKTSYKDFWESEHCPKNYPAPLIRHLNQRWKDDLDAVKWYDLENELLEYAIHGDKSDVVSEEEREYLLKTTDAILNNRLHFLDIDEIFASLNKKGLIIISNNTSNNPLEHAKAPFRDDCLLSPQERDTKALCLIKEKLCLYLSSIRSTKNASNTIAFQVLSIMDEYAKEGNTVDVYSFNYTPVGFNGSEPDSAIVHYVHGSCRDGNVIIGTRDDERISEEYDFLQKSFDDHYDPPALVEDLLAADEVIIFGHSIGENDRQYFRSFFKRQTDNIHLSRKDVIIFTRDEASERQIKRSLQRMTDWNLSMLLGQNNIQIIKTGSLKEDQRLLKDFLVKHGKDERTSKEIIGTLYGS